MSDLLYRIINPPVKMLLKSPFHAVMSKNTLLLEFTGRKSGRPLSTPISYYTAGGKAHCFTSKDFAWWRNLQGDAAVQIVIKGQRIKTHAKTVAATADTDNHKLMADALHAFLLAVPRDAAHAGVKLGEDGIPSASDIDGVIGGMVYLSFEV